ncbi:hypothetical protein GO986_09090 [Deinococcus sp. HMF7620]|uniref:Collagen-like protein n=1 Tax=Deinococcus arboris TaxID=2682977 RepID=A0A7C9M8G9_9DEIO|nr:collagen-like protein [Deinococcus arboris]MVN86919.1 hypothetical protein [Deinococcus arboris]
MTLPTDPPPIAAQWTFYDTFERPVPGPDYTGGYFDGGELVLGPMLFHNGQTGINADQANSILTSELAQSRWDGGGIQLQYDLTVVLTPVIDVVNAPACGFILQGDGAMLSWDGRRLRCSGDGWEATASLPPIADNIVQRVRLTVDPVANQLQLTRNQMGLSRPLPAQYLAGMTNATLVLFISNQPGNIDTQQISARFKYLALRNGDGTADLSSGISGGGLWLGGKSWMAPGTPDNGVGSDGDLWFDTSGTGDIYQKEAGTYVVRTQLLGAPGAQGVAGATGATGPAGPTGPAGADGQDGADGVDGQDGVLVGTLPTSFLLGDATAEEGEIYTVTDLPGGLAGIQLRGLDGVEAEVAVFPTGDEDWRVLTPTDYPHELKPGYLRLKRTDDSGGVTILRALVGAGSDGPVGGGGGNPGGGFSPFTITTDARGFQTIVEGTVTTDARGFQTVTNGTATTDSRGFQTVTRSSP